MGKDSGDATSLGTQTGSWEGPAVHSGAFLLDLQFSPSFATLRVNHRFEFPLFQRGGLCCVESSPDPKKIRVRKTLRFKVRAVIVGIVAALAVRGA